MNQFIHNFFSRTFFSCFKDQTEMNQVESICISSWRLHLHCISRTPPKRTFDYVHCALCIPSCGVTPLAKCYNRPSVSRLSASSFPERTGKRVLPLCGRCFYILPIASVNVTLCRAVVLTDLPPAHECDWIDSDRQRANSAISSDTSREQAPLDVKVKNEKEMWEGS